MENVKVSANAEQQHESMVNEAENFDVLIKTMVQIVGIKIQKNRGNQSREVKGLDGLYDTRVELEERIEDAKLRRSSIEMEAVTLENVYKIMRNFRKLYAIMSDEEKKSLITYLIKEIQIYPSEESEMTLKSIEFNFPIYIDGKVGALKS